MASATSAQATLLIDGYNIIGAWPRLQQVRDFSSLEEARTALIEDLIGYSAFQGYATQVIFDAQYQNTPSMREDITSLISIHFTEFGQTADTYIERFCAVFHHQRAQNLRQRLIVATSDRAQQLMVMGYGAEWMSAHQLRQDLEAITRQIQARQRSSKQPTKRLLAHSLDPKAQARLKQLRFGQSPAPKKTP